MTFTQAELDELCGSPLRDRASPTGLTTDLWVGVPVMVVPVRACVPTQRVDEKYVQEYLDNPRRRSYCGDVFGHIVVDQGCWLIEDGHHRWAAACSAGRAYWAARVFVL